MGSVRSPFELRPRQSSQLSSQSSIQPSKNIKVKIDKEKCVSKITKYAPPTAKQQTTKISEIANELNEIKEIIANQQKTINDSIKSINNDINEKCVKFGSLFASLKAEIEAIKTTQSNNNPSALKPVWRNQISNESIDFLLYGMCIERVEKEYKFQINEINRKIEALEDISNQFMSGISANIDEQCECEYGLFDLSICKIHSKNRDVQANISPFHAKNENNINDIIDGLQEQIDQVSQSIQYDEKEMHKMNQQIHNLSSKFTQFDAELNNHLVNFKQQHIDCNKESQNNDNSQRITNAQTKSTKANIFSFQNSATNRFIGKYNIHSNSDTLKVRVEYATIVDVNKFKSEFKKRFERRTGKASIKSVSISQYKLNEEGQIHQIDINIIFHTSLSHNYLNNITFPTNWTFFERAMERRRSRNRVR